LSYDYLNNNLLSLKMGGCVCIAKAKKQVPSSQSEVAQIPEVKEGALINRPPMQSNVH
jgi:hypothetical protein